MPFSKKSPKIDIHLWIEQDHLETLDQISREYGISRGAAIAALIEEYKQREQGKHEPVSRRSV